MIERDLSEGANVHTILVVEDEIILRFVACEFLRQAGFIVVEAANADEALPYVRTHPEVDLIFSDVRMPGTMDGLNLVRQLSLEFPHLRFVLASGDAAPAKNSQVPFFRKPYDLDEVVVSITQLLSFRSPKNAANDL
jgi:CheY-like chemotaxis protein